MSIDEYLKAVWKWLWLILLAGAVAGVSSYLATRSVPRVYQTKTTIMIGRFINDPNPDSGDLWISQQLGQTYAQLASREPVLQGAVNDLNLGDQLSWPALASNVRTSLVAGTQLMEIYVSDTNPQRARALADAIAQQLIRQSPTNPSSDQEDRRAFAQQQLEDLETKIENADGELEDLQDELDQAIGARQIQELEAQITAVQDKISSWQASYAQFLTFLQGGEVNYLTVVEPAAVPTVPISPRVELNVLAAVAIGGILATGAALLLEYLDDTVRTVHDLRRFPTLTALGSILRVEEPHPEGIPIAIKSPRAPAVEAYRSLRTNVQLASLDKPVRTLVVTSAGPAEGKSTIAANLAIVMAQAGLKTVLLDADLRRPNIHHLFELPNIGLSNALLDGQLPERGRPGNPGSLDLFLQPSSVENLSVLTSGSTPPNPAELLSSQSMKLLLSQILAVSELVIIDSPPALVVTDAVILSTLADGVLLVVRSGQTRFPLLRRTVEALERTGTPILGAVLNSIPSHHEEYYYLYGQRPRKQRGRSAILRSEKASARTVDLAGTGSRTSTSAQGDESRSGHVPYAD